MEYYPHRHITQLELLFRHKNTAIGKIKSIGLSCPYISSEKTYDQLFLDEVQKDFSYEESQFLKDGILCIYECLRAIECEMPVTEEAELKLFMAKHKEHFDRFRSWDGFNEEEEIRTIGAMLTEQRKRESDVSKNSIIALSRELAEFKVRLSRIGINPTIIDDEIEFSTENKNDTEIEAFVKKRTNPYPEIFTDGDSFKFFDHLHSVFYDENSNELWADFSMIYRRMHADGFILDGVRPTDYIKWIQDKYDIPLGTSLKKSENLLKIKFYEKIKILR